MQFPHYLLYVTTSKEACRGDWRFALQAADGSARLEVADTEPAVRGERLELLAVVRGLEALEQPSRVTLVTASRYVRRGIAVGLADWRDNGWRWEAYGRWVPIKHLDLWQRLDHALSVHRVELREFRLDGPHLPLWQQTTVRPALPPRAVGSWPSKGGPTAVGHGHRGTTNRRFSQNPQAWQRLSVEPIEAIATIPPRWQPCAAGLS